MLKGIILPTNLNGRYNKSLQVGNTPEHEPNAILRMTTQNYPDFVFEWHPTVQKVFVIRLKKDENGELLPNQKGEIVAFNIDNQGAAQNSMLIWLRGYQTAENPRERVPFLKAEDY
jgi:hypothetical protein